MVALGIVLMQKIASMHHFTSTCCAAAGWTHPPCCRQLHTCNMPCDDKPCWLISTCPPPRDCAIPRPPTTTSRTCPTSTLDISRPGRDPPPPQELERPCGRLPEAAPRQPQGRRAGDTSRQASREGGRPGTTGDGKMAVDKYTPIRVSLCGLRVWPGRGWGGARQGPAPGRAWSR